MIDIENCSFLSFLFVQEALPDIPPLRRTNTQITLSASNQPSATITATPPCLVPQIQTTR